MNWLSWQWKNRMTSCIRFSGVIICMLFGAAWSPGAMITNKRCFVKSRAMSCFESVAYAITILYIADLAKNAIWSAFWTQWLSVTTMKMHTVCVAGIDESAVVFDFTWDGGCLPVKPFCNVMERKSQAQELFDLTAFCKGQMFQMNTSCNEILISYRRVWNKVNPIRIYSTVSWQRASADAVYRQLRQHTPAAWAALQPAYHIRTHCQELSRHKRSVNC